MKYVAIAGAALLVTLAGSSASFAQSASQNSGPQAATAAAGQELYHVHIVKAAPGKLREMIDSYLTAPADPNASAQPLILRHVEGDDWDLLVLTPLGKEDKLTLAAPSAPEQQFIQRTRPLRALHADTFAVGPAWTETRAALAATPADAAVVPTSGSNASRDNGLYIVTTYRALPGHRDQLEQTIKKIAALSPGRYVTLQHMEGSPWDLLTVQRYQSWAEFATNEATPDLNQLRAQGFSAADAPGFELREHMAEHHDTLAVRVSAAK